MPATDLPEFEFSSPEVMENMVKNVEQEVEYVTRFFDAKLRISQIELRAQAQLTKDAQEKARLTAEQGNPRSMFVDALRRYREEMRKEEMRKP